MTKYIDKSAVVAEIEKRKNQFVSQAESFRKIGKKEQESYFAALASNMNSLSCFIDTLEAKEVDLDNELDFVKDAYYYFTSDERSSMKKVARHFFELGLRAKDVNEIIKTAEDHAYFAGSENTREKLIDKACKWLKTYRQDTPDGTGYTAGIVNDKTIKDFRKAMEE